MSTDRRQFQSGREVMQFYVQGYRPNEHRIRGASEAFVPRPSGTELARGLIQGLEEAIRSANTQPTTTAGEA